VKAAAKDESSGTPWRRISTILLFAGVLMAALAFANSGRAAVETPPPPSVWSDKADYAPGEQVTLSGANWAPGESVHIRVNDDAGETWRRDVDVTAAGDGAISDEFNLPDWFVAVYTVTATGASSGAVTWTFTDAVNTTTGVASSLNPSTSGGSVTFTSTTTCGSACTFPAGSSVRFVENANNGCNGGTLLGTATTLTGSGNSRQAAFTTSTLSAGAHSIRACFDSTSTSGSNAQSSVSAPMTQTVNSDTTPPDTSITSQPSNPSNSSSASFSFTGTDNLTSASSLTFECKLDAGAFTSCTSPKSYSGLADGSHTFQVRATDAAGNTDATPASFTWFVDTTAPDTSIDTNPSDPSSDTSASFTFSGTDNHSVAEALSFECQLDSGGWASCTSPETVSVAQGSHTFEVRATDEVGNIDDTPAVYTWFVDTTPPDVSIDSTLSNPTNSTAAAFTFSATDNHSASGDIDFGCQIDGGGFASCTSPKTYLGVGEGSHTFDVKSRDEAGNEDTASYTWFVDTTAPETSIDMSPFDPTNSTAGSFAFSGTDNHSAADDLIFECELDGTGFGSCSSPQNMSSLAEGSHTFKVKATDEAGNTDATPASFTWFVDTTAPDTSIDSNPSDATNSSSASFMFSGTDNHSAAGDLTFECELDGAGFGSCSSPESYTSLAEGSHTFKVRASDEAGNTDATAASFTWVVDTVAPSTIIDSNPSDPTSSTSASFAFHATDAAPSSGGLHFECKLDGGAFASCTSPESYSSLGDGSHTFHVRAIDAAGNTDATPPSYTWFVDTIAPNTSIDTNPSDPSSDTSASFTFSGTDNHSAAGDLTFECELDGAGFGSCSSPESYSALAEGSHTFKVRASDEAGNTDATPASYTWFVDTTAPDTTITAHPSNPSGSSSASFSFGGTDNHSAAGALTFRCELDGGGFGSCSSPKSYSGLGDGSHTFKVKATDEAGNTDATPDSFTWTVDTTGPSITLTTPPNGATYTQGQVVNAGYSCSDSSGVATCIGTVANLAQINTATIGSKSFTVNATDALGNASSLTHNYSVVYNFSGFFSPVDNPPICNVVKAGQAVPIKFSLHGNQGMNIFAAASPSSQPGTCSGLASDPLEETATAGQSTLNYDAQADQYAYVWKTEKSWSGTARLLTVTLADGTKHLARFTFTK
jgi:large repetitive protein